MNWFWLKTIIFHFIIIGWSLKLIFYQHFFCFTFFAASHNIKLWGEFHAKPNDNSRHSLFFMLFNRLHDMQKRSIILFIINIKNFQHRERKNIEHNFLCRFSFCSCRAKERKGKKSQKNLCETLRNWVHRGPEKIRLI